MEHGDRSIISHVLQQVKFPLPRIEVMCFRCKGRSTPFFPEDRKAHFTIRLLLLEMIAADGNCGCDDAAAADGVADSRTGRIREQVGHAMMTMMLMMTILTAV